MEDRIKALESNLKTVSKEFLEIKNLTVSVLNKIDLNFQVLDSKLEGLEKNLADLTHKVDNLDSHTSTGLNDVGTKIESLTDEISKISKVTGYEDLFLNESGLK